MMEDRRNFTAWERLSGLVSTIESLASGMGPNYGHRLTTKGPGSVAQEAARSKFLTVAEVAGELRVSTMTVYRLIKAEQLPATRIGKSLRIRETDVDRFLEGRFTEAG